MNQIQQCNGRITKVVDLSPTAREYTIIPDVPISFVAGAFVNVFVEHNGKTIRRAFSMSSSDQHHDSFTLTIRLSPGGVLTPVLWSEDFTNKTVRLMGPLGLNTADKMTSAKVFLFGFGVGAGVVKSLAEHMSNRSNVESLTIVTGNRNVNEMLHKDFFDELAVTHKNVMVRYVVSDTEQTEYLAGYAQDHINEFDFSGADVYMCGHGVACAALEAAVQATNPTDCSFFVEDFH